MIGERVGIPEAGCECRTIPDAPGYAVGRDGSMWSCWGRGKKGAVGVSVQRDYWRRIKGSMNNKYLSVALHGKSRRIHHLVLEAFVGQRPHSKMQCRHLNGNRLDNRAENLAWGTIQQNHDDKQRHGTTARGECIASAKLTTEAVLDIRESVANGTEYTPLAEKYGVSNALVGMVSKGLIWRHVGGPIVKSMRQRGERTHNSKTTESDVVKMRNEYLSGVPQGELAKRYGFNKRSIGDILLGRTWVHAGGPIAEPKDIRRVAAKLNESQVAEIKTSLSNGEAAVNIARRYGVSRGTIGDIKKGRTWPNVPAS